MTPKEYEELKEAKENLENLILLTNSPSLYNAYITFLQKMSNVLDLLEKKINLIEKDMRNV